jgi:hypothetical protein
MPSVEIDGAVELREAMRKFAPDLADNLEKEMNKALFPIVAKARGFVPAVAPLSKWDLYSRQRKGSFPWYDAIEIKNGINFSTEGTSPNRKGFAYAATIYNASPAGSIYETAGRKNPNGRKQSPRVNYYDKSGNVLGQKRSFNKRLSMSDNPNAGRQFISAMPPLYKVNRMKGQSGRLSRKMNGRLIFRAWGEDQGRAAGAINTALDGSIRQFKNRMGYVRTKKAV